MSSIDRAAHVAEAGIGEEDTVFADAFEHREMFVVVTLEMHDDRPRQFGQSRQVQAYASRLVTHSFGLQPQIEK